MSQFPFRVGQKVYCVEPTEGLEFGQAYTVERATQQVVYVTGCRGGYARSFSAIDPIVEGPDDTPLDEAFWERVGLVVRATTEDGWKFNFESLRVAPGVLLYVFDGSDGAAIKCPKVRTLGQLRRLVAAVLGEGE